MCGNGIRCVGKYVSDHGKTEQENLRIETDAGVRQLRLDKGTDRVAVTAVRVDMGTPEFVPEHISARFSYTGVSMGNPHCVIFLNSKEELDQIPMEVCGPEMEHHPAGRRAPVEPVPVRWQQRQCGCEDVRCQLQ